MNNHQPGLTLIEEKLRRGREFRAQGRHEEALEELRSAQSACSPNDPFWYNTVLNEIEITQGTAVLKSKPRAMSVVLTNKCNIQCIMCSVWDFEWELPEKTLDELRGVFPYLARIMWQGGEVLLHPRLELMFDEIAKFPHLQQHIFTNGLLFTPDWARRLARSNVSLIVSVDGVTSETYDHIRKNGRFEKLLEGLALLNNERTAAGKEQGQPLSLCTTMNVSVMRSNYHELERFVDFAYQHKFQKLLINPVDVDGPEDIFRNTDARAMAHIAAIVPKMKTRAKELGLEFHVWLPPLAKPSLIREPAPPGAERMTGATPDGDSRRSPNQLSCYWPWQLMHIDFGGRVRPHCFCGTEIGNVKDSSLLDLWNNEAMQTYRRRLHTNSSEGWCSNRCIAGMIQPEVLKLEPKEEDRGPRPHQR